MYTKRLVLMVGVVFMMAMALAPLAWAVKGAAFTTTNTIEDGTGHCQNGNEAVNCNIYDGKQYVWLNGGPLTAALGNGVYFFAVVVPGGQGGNENPNDGTFNNLSDTTADPYPSGSVNADTSPIPSGDSYTDRTFTISGGVVSYSGPHTFSGNKIRLFPYDDTTNPGGVYILAICRIDTQSTFNSSNNTYDPVTDPVTPDDCKYDAFKAPTGACTGECTPPSGNSLTACKYYDRNADGSFNGSDVALPDWPMTINPLDGATPQSATQTTGTTGCVTWTTLADGVYSITEGAPTQTTWYNSEPGPNPTPLVAPTGPSQTASLVGELETVDFGNFCKLPSGGLTLGFWSNKNGFDKMNDAPNGVGPELDPLLKSYHLRNGNGTDFDPGCYCQTPGGCPPQVSTPSCSTPFRTWLLSATATNMAYMLSAQLAAMVLNVEAGFVASNAFDLCSHETISELIAEADAALAANGNTTGAGPARTNQERLKNCLDALNNGAPVVPSTCPYSFSSSQ